MNEWQSRIQHIVDGHVHSDRIDGEARMKDIAAVTGIGKMALVSIQHPNSGSGLAQSLYLKHQHPDQFYVFAGLNHAEKLHGRPLGVPTLAEQVDRYVAMGCDGLKMIEGKPTSRQRMNVPVTDPYFEDYWARVEELGLPVVWHVNDPEEFWEPEKLPVWARERGWGYGPQDVRKEELYAEVDEVLARHPRLKLIFAHFYFLSADLPRATRFLEEHPTTHLDLAPGVEMLYNTSKNPDAGRDFFTRHAGRIVFGTDISDGLTVEEGRFRAGIVYRWLETQDTFRMPKGADFLLGPPEDGVVRGMSLPTDVLNRIYRTNFTRLAGAQPKPLNAGLACEECERLAALAERLSGTPAGRTEAGRAAAALAR